MFMRIEDWSSDMLTWCRNTINLGFRFNNFRFQRNSDWFFVEWNKNFGAFGSLARTVSLMTLLTDLFKGEFAVGYVNLVQVTH